jgi:hypothetical protein
MKKIGLNLSMIVVGTLAQSGDRPNVVSIPSDDQSWGDYGFTGHSRLKTHYFAPLVNEGLVDEYDEKFVVSRKRLA